MKKLLVLAPIVAAVAALYYWTAAGRTGKRDPDVAASQVTGWTAQSRAQLRAEVALHNAGKWPAFLQTDAAREQMLDCFVARLVSEVPEGPEGWKRLQGESAKLQALTARAGFDCGRELSDRIASATSWSADFAPVFVTACVQTDGEPLRAACDCLAAKAPDRFRSPAEFMGVLSTPRSKRAAANQKRLSEVLSSCADRSADAQAFDAR